MSSTAQQNLREERNVTMPNEDTDLAVQIATLVSDQKFLSQDVSDIKRAVTELLRLEKAIGELTLRHETDRDSMNHLWTKFDDTMNKVDARLNLAMTTAQAAQNTTDALRNRAIGAVWVFGVGFSALQGLVVAGLIWVLSTVNETAYQAREDKGRIDRIEKAFSTCLPSTIGDHYDRFTQTLVPTARNRRRTFRHP